MSCIRVVLFLGHKVFFPWIIQVLSSVKITLIRWRVLVVWWWYNIIYLDQFLNLFSLPCRRMKFFCYLCQTYFLQEYKIYLEIYCENSFHDWLIGSDPWLIFASTSLISRVLQFLQVTVYKLPFFCKGSR